MTTDFSPRIGRSAGPAPFAPSSYFYVAIFGGAVALAIVAMMNLPRLTIVRGLANRTYLLLAAMGCAAVAFLFVAPDEWWDPNRNIRLGLRFVAVAASVVLYAMHKGPALGGMQRSGTYTSMWKAIGPIIGGAVAQGLATAVVGAFVL